MTTSKFERLTDHLRKRITSGELAPGARLPSYPRLRQQFGVSTHTIRNAMLVLKTEGLIVSRIGEGVYVADNAHQAREPEQ